MRDLFPDLFGSSMGVRGLFLHPGHVGGQRPSSGLFGPSSGDGGLFLGLLGPIHGGGASGPFQDNAGKAGFGVLFQADARGSGAYFRTSYCLNLSL